MGRARFMFYPLFIFFFINRAAMGRARFMFYPLFIFLFYFFFFVGHQTQTSTRRTLNHAICNVYSRKLLKHKYTENVTDIGALIHGKCYGYCFL